MLLFALKRALWTIPVLLVCVTLLFGLVHAIGGGPLRHGPPLGLSHEAWVKYGDPKPGSITANQRRRLGIDAPWYDQYWRYVRSVAKLDFGPTTTFPNRTVNEILREQGPITAELVGFALVWVVVLGVGLGVAAAVWRGTVLDRAATATTALMMGIPLFSRRRSRSGSSPSSSACCRPPAGTAGARGSCRRSCSRSCRWRRSRGCCASR
jgi:ABC-type dipeptide/oligopeptide/nickel transport system permease component